MNLFLEYLDLKDKVSSKVVYRVT